jgi:geranylgeranyl diphosphate synthase type II
LESSAIFDLQLYMSEQGALVNGALARILDTQDEPTPILGAMTYSLMGGGKRIRPILCLAAARAVGGEPAAALPAALALEMIHTYSLIHDDLPALDDDALRRGQPTCHTRFDEPTAILAGDALLTLAFETLADAPGATKPADNYPDAGQWMQVVAIISKAVGYKGMIEGQMQDLDAEGKILSMEALETMHALKTGALIEASVHVGALLGNGAAEQIDALRSYARKIGLAFQVTDDMLNIKGDPDIMGKAVGTDRERRKNTYPTLLGLTKTERFAHCLVEAALQAVESFDNKAQPLRVLARYIVERNR